jgi:hypothetical protein
MYVLKVYLMVELNNDMTPAQLHKELVDLTHSLEKRNRFTNIVLSNPELVPIIIDIMFDVEDDLSFTGRHGCLSLLHGKILTRFCPI